MTSNPANQQSIKSGEANPTFPNVVPLGAENISSSKQPDELEEIFNEGKCTGPSCTHETADDHYILFDDDKKRLLSWRDRAVREARIDQMKYVDQRLIGNDTSGDRVFYDKEAVIAENHLMAQQRIISDAMKSELQDNQAKGE